MEEKLHRPVLRTPAEGAEVDDADIVFQWEPVPGAIGYRIQVARDRSFDEIIFSTRVGERDSLHVGGVLPRDHSTVYWRAQALSEEGPGPYSETYGFATLPPSEQDAPTTAMEGRQHEEIIGVDMSQGTTPAYELWLLVLAIGLSLGLIMIAAWQLTGISPVAERDLDQEQVMEGEFDAVISLDEYTPIDEEEGIYRIPLDRAIELMLQEREGGVQVVQVEEPTQESSPE